MAPRPREVALLIRPDGRVYLDPPRQLLGTLRSNIDYRTDGQRYLELASAMRDAASPKAYRDFEAQASLVLWRLLDLQGNKRHPLFAVQDAVRGADKSRVVLDFDFEYHDAFEWSLLPWPPRPGGVVAAGDEPLGVAQNLSLVRRPPDREVMESLPSIPPPPLHWVTSPYGVPDFLARAERMHEILSAIAAGRTQWTHASTALDSVVAARAPSGIETAHISFTHGDGRQYQVGGRYLEVADFAKELRRIVYRSPLRMVFSCQGRARGAALDRRSAHLERLAAALDTELLVTNTGLLELEVLAAVIGNIAAYMTASLPVDFSVQAARRNLRRAELEGAAAQGGCGPTWSRYICIVRRTEAIPAYDEVTLSKSDLAGLFRAQARQLQAKSSELESIRVPPTDGVKTESPRDSSCHLEDTIKMWNWGADVIDGAE